MDFQTNDGTQAGTDRIEALQSRIISLKRESNDAAFHAYLDQIWGQLKNAEFEVGRLEQQVETVCQKFNNRGAGYQSVQMYGQPARQYQQPTGQYRQPVQMYGQPAGQYQQPTGRYQQPVQMYGQPAGYQVPGKPRESVEYKIGTMIFGIVGIAFLLIAFVTFGLQFLNNVLQGVFLYLIGVVMIGFSEGFFAKRFEKFSYFLTGFGISSLYATTILNYVYLKIFPGWAALLATTLITAFFFYLSRKKNSGLLRIVCLIGCYISLAPVDGLHNLGEFAMCAAVMFLVNLAGVYCPVGKKQKAVDMIQYICSFCVLFYLMHLQWVSGLEMWPVYILTGTQILTLHLLYRKTEEEVSYRVLYFVAQAVHMGCLLYIGQHEFWIHFGVIGVTVLCAALTALLWKKKLRFGPYLFWALYVIPAYMIEKEAFWLGLVCLFVFIINKCLVRFFKEFPVPDAVYTMLSAVGVCLLMRSGEVQYLGYVYAVGILLSCIFMKKFKKYHIFTSLTFGWLFLLTEGCRPFLCSIFICVLAAGTIGAGFYAKDKSIRIYGLILMMFVALKLVLYDFYQSGAGIRILVFLIVGLLILGVSFAYIYLEKRLNEEKAVNRGMQN